MIGQFLGYVLEPTNLVMILVALATFGAFFTLITPLLEGDKMRSRMKAVASERERLKQQSREQLAQAKNKARLRETPQGFMANMVEKFNLRSIIDPQETRDRLKMAGLRRQAHLVTFVFFRAVGPFLFGVGVFVYLFLFIPDQTPMMRLCSSQKRTEIMSSGSAPGLRLTPRRFRTTPSPSSMSGVPRRPC